MKRNSTTLYLQSPGATTPIPWNDFLDSGEELEIIPNPEPTPVTDPAQFLQQMFANANFETWLNNFKQAGFLDAKVVQTLYAQLASISLFQGRVASFS